MFETHDPDTEMAIRHGRGFPYTTVGQWVLLADLPSQSKLLYALLRMHVNGQRGDDTCWPTQVTLAGLMGLKKPTDVGKYAKPLLELGAIAIEEVRWGPNRMYKRHIYTAYEAPPTDYPGHASLTSFYAEKAQVRSDIPSKGGPVTRSKGGPVTPSEGGPDLPQKGDQLPEPLTTRTEEQPEPKNEGAAAPLPVLGRSAPCGPGRLALENGGHQISGQLPTQAVEVTHHTRVRAHETPVRRHRLVTDLAELPPALHPENDVPFRQEPAQAGATPR